MATRRIAVDLLTRVEGEGALDVEVADGDVRDVRLKLFEPPRYFEALLVGRHFKEVPDMVARICGICPVAYQMSAVHALESLFAVEIGEEIRALRRLLYCGEWIESHALHIYMLHAPDFLGLDSALDLAKAEPELLRRGLRLKKAGDAILTLLGGRAIHPVSVCVGGFTRVPGRGEMDGLLDEIKWAREAAQQTVDWVAGFDFPDFQPAYTFVALKPEDEYPLNDGAIAAGDAHWPVAEFETHVEERQVEHSHALQYLLDGQPYLAGPLARLNLNRERLSPIARQALDSLGLSWPLTNPYCSIIARAIEVLQAVDEAIAIIEHYEPPPVPALPVKPRAGTGMAATCAPRGLLYHRYRVDSEGLIEEAKIVPPTAQNQTRMEADLRQLLPSVLHLDNQAAAAACERVIRSYDPCISCATHFLRLNIKEAKA